MFFCDLTQLLLSGPYLEYLNHVTNTYHYTSYTLPSTHTQCSLYLRAIEIKIFRAVHFSDSAIYECQIWVMHFLYPSSEILLTGDFIVLVAVSSFGQWWLKYQVFGSPVVSLSVDKVHRTPYNNPLLSCQKILWAELSPRNSFTCVLLAHVTPTISVWSMYRRYWCMSHVGFHSVVRISWCMSHIGFHSVLRIPDACHK
jgi:hypothetical protein